VFLQETNVAVLHPVKYCRKEILEESNGGIAVTFNGAADLDNFKK